ncbi:MAG: hypothetical protein WCJ09_04570 [Planctomycetota bacterium]
MDSKISRVSRYASLFTGRELATLSVYQFPLSPKRRSMYAIFNVIEGILWFVVATTIVVRVPRATVVQRRTVFGGAAAFAVFGVTDFLESGTDGRLPAWLWLLKIACGVAILASRYTYKGWDRFRWYDREFLFGIGCLVAVSLIIVLQKFVLTE